MSLPATVGRVNRRRLFAIGTLVLAVPLFAWPIVSPPPEPPDTFRFHTMDGAVMESGAGVEGGDSMEGNASVEGETDVERNVSVADGTGMGDRAETITGVDAERVAYENLSADAQRIVERTVANDGRDYRLQGEESVPEVFADADFRVHVVYEDRLYRFHVHQRSPAPSLGALGPRFGALVLSIVLGATGGYLVLSNE